MKNILFEQTIQSTKDSLPLNNNTISCYHRPRLSYFISPKNANKNKIRKISKNETKYLRKNGSNNKIESRLISLPKMNNSFENIINNNKENICNNSYFQISNKTKIINLNNKNIYLANMKHKNIDKIKNTKFNNYIFNSSLINENNKTSISKDIAIFCKIINSINPEHKNIKLSRNNKNMNKKITYIYSKKSIHLNEKKIIKIQRWWRKNLYHLYIEKYILIIQNQYRKYIKRKREYIIKENNIRKIVIIQRAWRDFMKKRCLNNYYFFSFKKYIKPQKKNRIYNMSFGNLVLDNINTINICKDTFKKYNFISKAYYKKNQINNIIIIIEKLQKKIRKYLNNKNKEIIIRKNKLLLKNEHYTKEVKYYSFLISDDLISKIKKIQQKFRKHLYFNKNKEILKLKFTSYISFKLSQLFILVLNRINIFYFLKIFHQKIKKNINEFIFLKIFQKEKEANSYSYFFQTIWRNIKINTDTNNEISLLLKCNIPKFFQPNFSKTHIPYINYKQEEKLINTQLFNKNDEELINYIFYFLTKEKMFKMSINKKYIKNHLNKYNLRNRNIFCITKYIDLLYKDLVNKKLRINENKENIPFNDEKCYILTEENDDDINKKNNEINNNFIINRTKSYCSKNFRYKFIDYLNKNSEINKWV